MKDIEEAIKALDQIDVGFYCTHESPGGCTTVPLSLDLVKRYNIGLITRQLQVRVL